MSEKERHVVTRKNAPMLVRWLSSGQVFVVKKLVGEDVLARFYPAQREAEAIAVAEGNEMTLHEETEMSAFVVTYDEEIARMPLVPRRDGPNKNDIKRINQRGLEVSAAHPDLDVRAAMHPDGGAVFLATMFIPLEEWETGETRKVPPFEPPQ